MAELTERIRRDLTAAMKARDAARTSTLRLLQAAIQNEEIDKGHTLSDEEAQVVLRRAAKQRADSIEQYERGSRNDLADKERAELEIIEGYLPRQLGDDETERIVHEAIALTGASSRKDTGLVMRELMARHKGQIDGKKAQEILQRLLAG
ncbi:MAG TPA: GatB/YqeY domain-containing protein [Thermoanaerobaculia bacterium]|nr:GatB/YqeY domain-containing protein [Thermoanaerobaculia bacterium]